MTKAYTFSDVSIIPCYSDISSRTLVDLSSDFRMFKITLPVISANMRNITGAKMANALIDYGAYSILHRFNPILQSVQEFKDTNGRAGVSIGVQDEDRARFTELYKAGARVFCIDVAHGHHKLVYNMLKWIYNNFYNSKRDFTVIAGNVATYDGALYLADSGANVLKVGIGPGRVCTTRRNTGVGVPQLYALEQVSLIKKKFDVQIIADGGVVYVGDIAKALKYADAVMIGSMFAGTTETPGNVFKNENNQYYKIYGGSASAENKQAVNGDTRFVEGITTTAPFKGKVKYILKEIEEGLRSAFSYVGAQNLSEFQKKCEFIEISEGGRSESKF